MRSISKSCVVVVLAGLPRIAAAAEPAEGQPASPVTLPEEPEAATAPSAPASKDFGAPKTKPESGPASSAPAAVAPPAGPAPPPAPLPPGTPPPGLIYAPVPQPYAPVEVRPNPPEPDSPPHKPLGPLKSHVDISFNVDTVWYTGPSFDFFSEKDNATSPGVSLGYSLWLAEPLSIVPELGWGTNTVSQDGMFGGAIMHTEVKSHDLYGGLSVRYGLLSFLDTHVRVAGGASILDARVEPSGLASGLESSGLSPFGTLGGGLSLHSPAGALETRGGALRSVIGGITVEGGYRMGSDFEVNPTPAAEAGRIPTTYMSLGKLERSGPYVRTSLVVRF